MFAGIGGMRVAAESLGFECVFSSEIDKHAQKTYEANFGDVPHGDIKKIDADDIPDFDLLLAGFPCQPFSYAGSLRGLNDARGTLFYDLLRILEAKRPRAFLFENVKGLVSHDRGRTLGTVETLLAESGYSFGWTVLDSSDFGLAQKRERWYCVGFDRAQAFSFPTPTPSKTKLADVIDGRMRDEALALSPAWRKRIDAHLRLAAGAPAGSQKARVEHEDFRFQGKSSRARHGVFSYMKPDRTLRFHMGDPKKTQVQEGFFVSKESLAPTLIAGRVPQLWDLKRRLSVRECAKLQGFPASFKFPCSNAQSYRQLGNAVSVPVIRAILAAAEAALSKPAAKRSSRSRERAA